MSLVSICYSTLYYSLCFFFFFFNDTATTEIYTLSLHDALPIFDSIHFQRCGGDLNYLRSVDPALLPILQLCDAPLEDGERSEEHTSELQSHLNLVCRLLLEKKKKIQHLCTDM